MATHPSILAWRIPWTEEPNRLQSMGLQRVRHDSTTVGDMGSIPGLGRSYGEGNGYPPQYSCLENPMDRRAYWTVVHVVTKNQT